MIVDPIAQKNKINELFTTPSSDKCIAYKYTSADVESNIELSSNVWFETMLDSIYEYVQSHLVQNSYQIDKLQDIISVCNDSIIPDVIPAVDMALKYYEFNSFKANVPKQHREKDAQGNIVLTGSDFPVPANSTASALYKQNQYMYLQQKAYLSALFSTNYLTDAQLTDTTPDQIDTTRTNIYSATTLSDYLFISSDLSANVGEENREQNYISYVVKDEFTPRLTLNVIPLMDSVYSNKKPTIIQSSYVLSRLNELINVLSNIRIFNYNAFFKKTVYSAKMFIYPFYNTSDVKVSAKEYAETVKYSLSNKQFVRYNTLITPYIRYYNESDCGVKNLYLEDKTYNLQSTENTNYIELLDSIKFIYTTDETSDVPTFDFSSQFGSNGNFTFYKTIQSEKSYLADKIDLSIFNITQGSQIYANDVIAAIQYIFRMWIENIKTYYYTLYICHSNCHNNGVLDEAIKTRKIQIVYMQCSDYGEYSQELQSIIMTNGKDYIYVPLEYNEYQATNGYFVYGSLTADLVFDGLTALNNSYFKCNQLGITRRQAFPNFGKYDAKVLNMLGITNADEGRDERLAKYASTTVNNFNSALRIQLINNEYKVPAINRSSLSKNMSIQSFNAVLLSNTLYCLDVLDTLLVKYFIVPKTYTYTVEYYVNNTLQKTVERTFNALDNNNHVYVYMFRGNLDGIGRPCIFVCITDIDDKTYKYNINRIVINDNYGSGDVEVVSTQNITAGQVSNNVIIRKYSDIDNPAEKYNRGLPIIKRNGQEYRKNHDTYRTSTHYTYKFRGRSIQLDWQWFVPLLDYYSKNSYFYTCRGLYHIKTPNMAIPAELAPCKVCGQTKPLTNKYAILPLELSRLKLHPENTKYTVKVYCS